MSTAIDPASFRDPAGFVYERDGQLYRQVNAAYAASFELLERSGLYDELVAAGLLVPHERAAADLAAAPGAYAVIRPRRVPFVSYPSEWCFGQLRDAALVTLEIQRRALAKGMILRDARASNVQFLDGRPVLIDTLSFGPYEEGQPWYAYGQFCQQFLAPLALMAHRDARLAALLGDFADGVPLELAARLLGARAWLRPGLALHLGMHAAAQRRHADDDAHAARGARARVLPRRAIERLVEHLASTVRALRWRPPRSAWRDYGDQDGYAAEAQAAKAAAVREMVARVAPRRVLDLGANTGVYSRVAGQAGAGLVVAVDGDAGAVERNYEHARTEGDGAVLPLVMDLMRPTPAAGWRLAEQRSLLDRADFDLVMALALVHHLVLSANVPLPGVMELLAGLAPAALVEFVPPDDPQAARLLARRPEAPHEYSREAFEAAARQRFEIVERRALPRSARVLYGLARRGPARP